MYPDDLRYSKTHEWLRPGDPATVGITHYAQDELGDVVYVELPDAGRTYSAGERFGSVESVKTVSDLYVPASGEVTEVNTALADHPELINSSPYGEGWMLRLRLSDPSELDKLMDAQAYQRSIAQDH
jgi:glycine cleavage system H protein